MGIKKYIIAAVLVALPLVAGCQQRTDFDACVEYFEENVKGTSPDLIDASKLEIWNACRGRKEG